MIKNILKLQEEVKKSGLFLLLEKMYNPNLHLNNSNHINTFRKVKTKTSKTYQADEIDLTNENNIDNNIEKNEDRKKKMKNKSIRIGHKANDSTNLSNNFTNPTLQMSSHPLDITVPKSSGNLDPQNLDDFIIKIQIHKSKKNYQIT